MQFGNFSIVAIYSTLGIIASTLPALAGAPVGAVFTATNDPTHNEIVVFARSQDGSLEKQASVATGGAGTGGQLDPLGSQGSLKLTANARWLLAVNAGSNEISVFKVRPDGLELRGKTGSLGTEPVSLAVREDIVYVLNAGGSPNIAGFQLKPNGALTPLDKSVRTFSGVAAGALAQIGFDHGGENLIVTDRTDNTIITFPVGDRGLPATAPITSPAQGKAPFGFTFDPSGLLLVVDAGSGIVGSYALDDSGNVDTIASSAGDGQKASCWIGATRDGYVYTTNPGSSTLSSFSADAYSGSVTLLEASAATAKTPLDLAIVQDRFLYAVDPTAGGVDTFEIGASGSLTSRGVSAAGLAIFAQGLAAY